MQILILQILLKGNSDQEHDNHGDGCQPHRIIGPPVIPYSVPDGTKASVSAFLHCLTQLNTAQSLSAAAPAPVRGRKVPAGNLPR